MTERSLIRYQSFASSAEHSSYIDELQEFLDRIAGDDVEFEVASLETPAKTVHPLTEWRCGADAIRNAVQAERDGAVAFVEGHFPDPGLHEMRASVDIPVVGLGEASMLYSCLLARRTAIVTINPTLLPTTRDQIVLYGLRERIPWAVSIETDPQTMNSAFTDRGAFNDIVDQFTRSAAPLVAEGAELVIPGGGFPALLLTRIDDFRIDGAPVLNPIAVAAQMAETGARLQRLTGVTASRVGAFSKPPDQALQEFLTA